MNPTSLSFYPVVELPSRERLGESKGDRESSTPPEEGLEPLSDLSSQLLADGREAAPSTDRESSSAPYMQFSRCLRKVDDFLGRELSVDPSKLSVFENFCEVAKRLDAVVEEGDIDVIASSISLRVSELRKGEPLLLPGGLLERDPAEKGAFVRQKRLYFVEKRGEGSYSFIVINGGEGSHYYPSYTLDGEVRGIYQLAIEDVGEESLDASFFKGLFLFQKAAAWRDEERWSRSSLHSEELLTWYIVSQLDGNIALPPSPLDRPEFYAKAEKSFFPSMKLYFLALRKMELALASDEIERKERLSRYKRTALFAQFFVLSEFIEEASAARGFDSSSYRLAKQSLQRLERKIEPLMVAEHIDRSLFYRAKEVAREAKGKLAAWKAREEKGEMLFSPPRVTVKRVPISLETSAQRVACLERGYSAFSVAEPVDPQTYGRQKPGSTLREFIFPSTNLPPPFYFNDLKKMKRGDNRVVEREVEGGAELTSLKAREAIYAFEAFRSLSPETVRDVGEIAALENRLFRYDRINALIDDEPEALIAIIEFAMERFAAYREGRFLDCAFYMARIAFLCRKFIHSTRWNGHLRVEKVREYISPLHEKIVEGLSLAQYDDMFIVWRGLNYGDLSESDRIDFAIDIISYEVYNRYLCRNWEQVNRPYVESLWKSILLVLPSWCEEGEKRDKILGSVVGNVLCRKGVNGEWKGSYPIFFTAMQSKIVSVNLENFRVTFAGEKLSRAPIHIREGKNFSRYFPGIVRETKCSDGSYALYDGEERRWQLLPRADGEFFAVKEVDGKRYEAEITNSTFQKEMEKLLSPYLLERRRDPDELLLAHLDRWQHLAISSFTGMPLPLRQEAVDALPIEKRKKLSNHLFFQNPIHPRIWRCFEESSPHAIVEIDGEITFYALFEKRERTVRKSESGDLHRYNLSEEPKTSNTTYYRLRAITPTKSGRTVELLTLAEEEPLLRLFSSVEEKEYIAFWGRPQESGASKGERSITAIDLPRLSLSFEVERVDQGVARVNLAELPGYFLSERCDYSLNRAFPGTLLLTNDYGEERLLIPEQAVKATSQNFAPQIEAFPCGKRRRGGRAYSIVEVERQGKEFFLRAETFAGALRIALPYIARRRYGKADRALSAALPKGALTKEERRLLRELCFELNENHSHPMATALLLRLLTISVEHSSPTAVGGKSLLLFNESELSTLAVAYERYTNDRANARHLKLAEREELLLLDAFKKVGISTQALRSKEPIFVKEKTIDCIAWRKLERSEGFTESASIDKKVNSTIQLPVSPLMSKRREGEVTRALAAHLVGDTDTPFFHRIARLFWTTLSEISRLYGQFR